jgi:hypothetical protein
MIMGNEEYNTRYMALQYAMQLPYRTADTLNQDDKKQMSVDEILEAAKKFQAYLEGK